LVSITELRRPAELCAFRGAWSDLWQRCPNATPFSSPEWLLPWTRHLYGGGEIWSLAAWDGGRLTGFAPLFLHGAARKQISFLGAGVTDYLDFLLEGAMDGQTSKAAAEALCNFILRSAGGWDRCELVDIPPDSVLLAVDFPAARLPSSICPVVELPSSIAALEAKLSPKFRHNLRNSMNRARDAGIEFAMPAPGEDSEFLEALFRLHEARWRSRGETGVLASAEIQDFLREALSGFGDRGWLRFAGLRHLGVLHAVVCIFCARRRWLYYLGGFDEHLARFGPGNLLLRFAMEQAIEEGAREFDFLRNGEAYKYRWGAKDRVSTRLVLPPENSAESSALVR
jgi:CelD/BcsL family acetyltransferase involved in cellulose biosynthesis